MPTNEKKRHGKSVMTPHLVTHICGILREGNYVETACLAAGVSKSTYYTWLRRANEDEAAGENTMYVDFKNQVEKSRAEAEVALLESIKNGDKGWQAKAWVLERTKSGRFGQKQTVEQTIEMRPPALPPNAPKTYDKWLERRKQRSLETAKDAEFKNMTSDTEKERSSKSDQSKTVLRLSKSKEINPEDNIVL